MVQMSAMDDPNLHSMTDELRKIARKEIGQLLSSLAQRKGVSPSALPSIRQASNVAKVNRPRAAEIATRVRSYLKQPRTQAV